MGLIIGLIIGFLLAIFVPLLSLGILLKFDFYQTGRFNLILLSFAGGVVAFVLASLINRSLVYFGLAEQNTVTLYDAPIVEEILKGLVLLILIKRSQITYSIDGALYGFAAGMGFAIYENFGYMFSNLAAAAEISLSRVVSANLVHASSSAMVGIALGMIHVRRTWLRWLAFALGLFLAISQHMVYNKISLDLNIDSLAVTAGIGFLGTGFVFLAMQVGKMQARQWIKQQLKLGERITRGEIAAIDHLTSTQDLLFPVYERFGVDKAIQVERLLYLEARLGIKRKALDGLQKNNSLRKTLEGEVNKLRTEIKAMHRAIGIYVMLFVRGLFTEEMISVWEQMQAKIQERSNRNGGQKGGGLWATLEERLKNRRAPKGSSSAHG